MRDVKAAVSLDIGEATVQTTYAVTMRPGGVLFVGANDCATYEAPAVRDLPPQLTQVSAPTTVGAFEVRYRAATPGAADLRISCTGPFCHGSVVTVVVTIAGG